MRSLVTSFVDDFKKCIFDWVNFNEFRLQLNFKHIKTQIPSTLAINFTKSKSDDGMLTLTSDGGGEEDSNI